MESREDKRSKIDVHNLELVELLEKFKTHVVLDAIGLPNTHNNRSTLTGRRLLNGRFKDHEIENIKHFLYKTSNLIKKMDEILNNI